MPPRRLPNRSADDTRVVKRYVRRAARDALIPGDSSVESLERSYSSPRIRSYPRCDRVFPECARENGPDRGSILGRRETNIHAHSLSLGLALSHPKDRV
jgi:hypothetical protein